MNRYERLNRLLALLAERGTVEVEGVAAELEVSVATVRRDLDHLAEQQLLTRTRGGAVANSVAYDLPLRYKSARNASQKQRIAAAAARLVAPGTVVGLTGGTTTTELARELATAAASGLTVVTNALNIAGELTVRQHVKLVVTGGVARPQSYELIGPLGAATLAGLSIDVTFLGVDAVDAAHGVSAHHEGEAEINRLLAVRARRVVVVADGSKFDASAFARICTLDEIDTLVTDDTAPAATLRAIAAAGVEIVRA